MAWPWKRISLSANSGSSAKAGLRCRSCRVCRLPSAPRRRPAQRGRRRGRARAGFAGRLVGHPDPDMQRAGAGSRMSSTYGAAPRTCMRAESCAMRFVDDRRIDLQRDGRNEGLRLFSSTPVLRDESGRPRPRSPSAPASGDWPPLRCDRRRSRAHVGERREISRSIAARRVAPSSRDHRGWRRRAAFSAPAGAFGGRRHAAVSDAGADDPPPLQG